LNENRFTTTNRYKYRFLNSLKVFVLCVMNINLWPCKHSCLEHLYLWTCTQ